MNHDQPQHTRPEIHEVPPAAPVAATARVRRGFPILPFILAVAAAAAAWPVLEANYNLRQPSEEAASQAYDFRALNKETGEANSLNAAYSFGALGGLLGLGLGLAGGLGRRSATGALLGALVGAGLGLAAGVLPPFLLMPMAHMRREELLRDPALGFGIHLGLWAPLGAMAGLAYALGRYGVSARHLVMGLMGGLIGATLGTLVYDIIGAVVLTLHSTQNPFAATQPVDTKWLPTRLLCLGCVAIGSAIGAVLATRGVRDFVSTEPTIVTSQTKPA